MANRIANLITGLMVLVGIGIFTGSALGYLNPGMVIKGSLHPNVKN